jgi:nitrate/nitrite transporter NarK
VFGQNRDWGCSVRWIRCLAALMAVALVLTIAGPAFAGVSASPAVFCAKADGRFFPRHADVGTAVSVNAGVDNCGNEREHVLLTWRISGPCHPHFSGSDVFVLARSSAVVEVFSFRPMCVGQYRLTVRAYHGNRVVDVARDYLRARGA